MTLPVERLDRSRSFGTVHGPDAAKVRYRQAALGLPDWPYDVHGKLMEAALTKEQRTKLTEKREAAKKAPPVEIAPEDDQPLDAPPEPKIPADEGAVNLVMWLRGEAKYRYADVQKAIRDRFHADKPYRLEAARYLIEDKKIVPRSEVHPSILPPPMDHQ